jgi:hypothetical protein
MSAQQDTLLEFERDDVTLLIDALAKAAARHECQANYVLCGRKHDDKAAAMRRLRARLMQYRVACERAPAA